MKKIDLIGTTFGYLKVINRKTINKKNKIRTYWVCECICGTMHEVEHGALKRGNVKSCGCKTKEIISKKLKKGSYHANMVVAFHNCVNSATQRGYTWEINIETFHLLSQKTCFYCDILPNNISNSRKTCEPFKYNGLDRINNLIGYTIDNVVPCCKECNLGKGVQSQKEFFERVRRINIKHKL